MIRKADKNDLERIVKVHIKAFPENFMTKLGSSFLFQYYKTILLYENGIILVFEDEMDILGFVAGFYKPQLFYTQLKSRKLILGFSILIPLIKNPMLCYRLFATYRRTDDNTNKVFDTNLCELSSIGVNPNTMGRGVGKSLVQAFINEAVTYESNLVYLYTDKNSNERVNRFYQEMGFIVNRSFVSFGNREIVEFHYNI